MLRMYDHIDPNCAAPASLAAELPTSKDFGGAKVSTCAVSAHLARNVMLQRQRPAAHAKRVLRRNKTAQNHASRARMGDFSGAQEST